MEATTERFEVTVEPPTVMHRGLGAALRAVWWSVVSVLSNGLVEGPKVDLTFTDKRSGEVVLRQRWGRDQRGLSRALKLAEERLESLSEAEFAEEYGIGAVE